MPNNILNPTGHRLVDYINPRLIAEGVMASQTMRNAANAGYTPLNPSFVAYNGNNPQAADNAAAMRARQAKDQALRSTLVSGGVLDRKEKLYKK